METHELERSMEIGDSGFISDPSINTSNAMEFNSARESSSPLNLSKKGRHLSLPAIVTQPSTVSQYHARELQPAEPVSTLPLQGLGDIGDPLKDAQLKSDEADDNNNTASKPERRDADLDALPNFLDMFREIPWPIQEAAKGTDSPKLKQNTGHGHAPKNWGMDERSNLKAGLIAKKPRVKFDVDSISKFEALFNVTQYPDTEELERLATETGYPCKSVRSWFTNRRARVKKTVWKENLITELYHEAGFSPGPAHGSLQSRDTAADSTYFENETFGCKPIKVEDRPLSCRGDRGIGNITRTRPMTTTSHDSNPQWPVGYPGLAPIHSPSSQHFTGGYKGYEENRTPRVVRPSSDIDDRSTSDDSRGCSPASDRTHHWPGHPAYQVFQGMTPTGSPPYGQSYFCPPVHAVGPWAMPSHWYSHVSNQGWGRGGGYHHIPPGDPYSFYNPHMESWDYCNRADDYARHTDNTSPCRTPSYQQLPPSNASPNPSLTYRQHPSQTPALFQQLQVINTPPKEAPSYQHARVHRSGNAGDWNPVATSTPTKTSRTTDTESDTWNEAFKQQHQDMIHSLEENILQDDWV